MAKKQRSSSSGKPVISKKSNADALRIPAVDLEGTKNKAQGASETSLKGRFLGASTSSASADIKGDWSVMILIFMMFLTPAIGVPYEEMLQDTLKSIVVASMTLGSAAVFFWQQRMRQQPLRWHSIMWFPLGLMVYALGSMAWSHTYLAAVEAIRWFIFSLLLWLGLNVFSREKFPTLALAVHWGAVMASLWTALQFWIDFSFFPQGANPASTFVNRNFFAEFAVCTIPFSAYLLARARHTGQIALLACTSAFTVVAVLMTGTRSALAALWLMLFLLLPLIAFLFRKQFAFPDWSSSQRKVAVGTLIVTFIGLGLINTGNPNIAGELRGANALERGLYRSVSVVTDRDEFVTGSLSVRMTMWKATARMIQAHPLSGVGAGAWEVDAPLYQADGTQLETDYYAHNELLQLLAEYGLVGWISLIGLLAYLLQTAWQTLRARAKNDGEEGALRILTLTSMFALLLVSNAGFPWRLAATGALFAVCLGILGASDARLTSRPSAWSVRLPWRPSFSKGALIAVLFGLYLTVHISQQAATSEFKLVSAVKLALTISQSGEVNHPRWNRVKREILILANDGIAINPHYRKITPMVADHLAQWGDWKNATEIWESVTESRPYIAVMLSNVARGYAQTGNMPKALEYLERCKALQPRAVSVRSLEVILLSRTDRELEATRLAKQYLAENTYDYDLANAAWILGMRSADYDLAILGLELRNKGWPINQIDGYLKLGNIYAFHRIDEGKALASYRAAMAAAPANSQEVLFQIPPAYRSRLLLRD